MLRNRVLFLGVLMMLTGIFSVGTSLLSRSGRAETYTVKKGILSEIVFSSLTNDKAALYKGRELYNNYWAQYGIDPADEENVPEFARYVALKKGASEKRFIAYLRKTELGGECALLGCEISFFENTSGNQWRLVASISTYHVWVSNQTTQGYYDLYSLASFIDPTEVPKQHERQIPFIWTGSQYESIEQLNNSGGAQGEK
ncbi:MAG: hypothetical protein H6857_00025 [Rhodospirillales bacterium]|nr:hypothetical protein [Rhodospirillales bacterium]